MNYAKRKILASFENMRRVYPTPIFRKKHKKNSLSQEESNNGGGFFAAIKTSCLQEPHWGVYAFRASCCGAFAFSRRKAGAPQYGPTLPEAPETDKEAFVRCFSCFAVPYEHALKDRRNDYRYITNLM